MQDAAQVDYEMAGSPHEAIENIQRKEEQVIVEQSGDFINELKDMLGKGSLGKDYYTSNNLELTEGNLKEAFVQRWDISKSIITNT